MTSPTPSQASPATPSVHPDRQQRVATALKRYRIAAIATGIWLLVLVVEMFLKYVVFGSGNEPGWFSVIGPLHGIFYMVYVMTCVNLGTTARWPVGKWVITMLGGVVPFLSFYVERQRTKEVVEAFQLR